MNGDASITLPRLMNGHEALRSDINRSLGLGHAGK
jgi:hypothetical protein